MRPNATLIGTGLEDVDKGHKVRVRDSAAKTPNFQAAEHIEPGALARMTSIDSLDYRCGQDSFLVRRMVDPPEPAVVLRCSPSQAVVIALFTDNSVPKRPVRFDVLSVHAEGSAGGKVVTLCAKYPEREGSGFHSRSDHGVGREQRQSTRKGAVDLKQVVRCNSGEHSYLLGCLEWLGLRVDAAQPAIDRWRRKLRAPLPKLNQGGLARFELRETPLLGERTFTGIPEWLGLHHSKVANLTPTRPVTPAVDRPPSAVRRPQGAGWPVGRAHRGVHRSFI